MASSSALGRSGPERERVAYGTLIQCFTGWAALSAHPGQPPRSAAGIWTDPLTASLETLLLLAAIWRQRVTGRGCFFDISMAEATIAALPEPILAWSLNQELLEPRGNRDPLFAPQGATPRVATIAGWRSASRTTTPGPTSARSSPGPTCWPTRGLSSAAGRRTRHDELDAAISAWTRTRPADQAAAQLQAAGHRRHADPDPGRRADRRPPGRPRLRQPGREPGRRQSRHAWLPLADRRPAPGRLPAAAGRRRGQPTTSSRNLLDPRPGRVPAAWSTTRSSIEGIQPDGQR